MISIDWGTKIIYIPKTYMNVISVNPFEIRELDINEFRLDLRNLEANIDGIPHLRTHEHNTEIILGNITLARVVAIVNDYTITFENGNYAVDLVGANSNISDVTNLNNVQVRSYNSAGLISLDNNTGSTIDAQDIATAVWSEIASGQTTNSFGQLLIDLISKSDKIQHTLNVHTELLKNKPNNC